MIDKTLDGHCCKKDNEGNPHTFYIEQSTIPILLDDCKQGDGVKYYLADVVDKRIAEFEARLANMNEVYSEEESLEKWLIFALDKIGYADSYCKFSDAFNAIGHRITELERQNTHLQANNTKLLLDNRMLRTEYIRKDIYDERIAELEGSIHLIASQLQTIKALKLRLEALLNPIYRVIPPSAADTEAGD